MADVDDLSPLLDLLDLEPLDRDLFRGRNPVEGTGRLFGGQVAAQALRATTLTVDADRHVHSMHGYFLRPGRRTRPVIYSVDRIREGRSFTTRRVVGIQDGEAIFNLEASFHVSEPGPEFQLPPLSGLADPETAPPRTQIGPHHRPIDARELESIPPSTRRVWIRAAGRLDDDPNLHACVLTYASDMGPVRAAAQPVLDDGPMMRASLDHTMWFHRPVRADGWLLYDLEAVAVAGGRGLARGMVFDRDGVLVASIAQEALLRPVREVEA